MSSILDALRELEGGGTPASPDRGPSGERPPSRFRAGAVLAMIALGGAFVVYRGSTPSDPPDVVARPGPEVAPPPVPAPAMPAATPAATPPVPPRARITPRAPAALAVAAAAERPRREPAPRRVMADVPMAPPAPPAEDDGSVTSGAAGEPRIRLTGLVYDAVPEHRTATLSVDGGKVVTLHEGQSAGGVEVSLILSDRVYVRHRGNIFALHTN